MIRDRYEVEPCRLDLRNSPRSKWPKDVRFTVIATDGIPIGEVFRHDIDFSEDVARLVCVALNDAYAAGKTTSDKQEKR